jgi:hypothetical protein
MPSVFTIEGAEKSRCKIVKNPKTGCSVQLCFVGKSKKNRSGWKFMKGSTRCSR